MARKKFKATFIFVLVSILMVAATPFALAESNCSSVSFTMSSFVKGIWKDNYHSLSKGSAELYGSETTNRNFSVKTWAYLYYKSASNDYNYADSTLLNNVCDVSSTYNFDNYLTAPSNNDYYWLEFCVTPHDEVTITGSGYICNP